MYVVTLVPRRFFHFDLDAMCVGPSILTDAGDLPGNFDSRPAGFYREAAIAYLRRYNGLRELADHGELISKIRVERLKPRRHCDDCRAAAVCDDGAVVDILHVGRFDEGVIEIFVGRVERM